MSASKLKLKQDSWFYSHSGYHPAGGISRCLMRHLPQVFTYYLLLTINFSHLYRNSTMTEFEFFTGKEDRWGDSMRALWGNLSICPTIDHVKLPYHTWGNCFLLATLKSGEMPKSLTATWLTSWFGQEMSWMLKGYGMGLVWISPHQAWAPTMDEALRILSALPSSGPDWLYILIQSYDSANHVPLPKDKHLGVLPQGKAENPCGWISQLEVHQLLSARTRVIYTIGLNGGNQSITIDLPELLHSSSSVTNDEHTYLKIDIPSPTPEEQDCANLPLG